MSEIIAQNKDTVLLLNKAKQIISKNEFDRFKELVYDLDHKIWELEDTNKKIAK